MSRGRNVQAESLLSLAATAAAEHNFQNVLDTVVNGLAQQPGVAHARIWLLNPGDICQDCFFAQACEDRTQCLHSVAAHGNSISVPLADLYEQFRRIPLANFILGQVAQKGISVLRNDAQEAVAGLTRAEWFKQEGIVSFAAHPLIAHGQPLGVLFVSSRESISEQEYAWLKMFADQAAVAITNAKAFMALEEAKAVEEHHARQLRQVIDLAPLHMFIWEADASISYGNRATTDYFGPIPPKHPMEFLDLVTHPEDVEALKSGIKRAFGREELFEMEVRMRRQDGEYHWFRYQLNPLRNDRGQISRWCGTRVDIDNQKRAAAQAQKEYLELREHFNQLQQIMDVVPLHLYLVQTDGTAIASNRSVEEFWGPIGALPPREFLNRFAHPDDLEKMWREFQKANETGEELRMEARLKGRTGDYRWFREHMVPIRDDTGHVLRWCGLHIDIDDQKRAQDRAQQENLVLREEVDRTSMFEEIVGTSPALQSVLTRVAKVAPSDSTVLIIGETGTGKELIARAIHKRSPRAGRAFVSVNCAAIPRDLIASELFGHEKGAFTGALQRRLGRFELAEGGTLFLDEIGELPQETQVALLRVLQEREFDRLGGTRPIRADVRVITATHRDLPAEVAAGIFRSDLYYRINVFPVQVPALRERREDIRLLAEYFIDRFASKMGKKITKIDRKSLEHLQTYSWPGNIRELQNVIERSVIVCDTDEFSVDESWLTLRPGISKPLREDMVVQERERIEAALTDAKGRVSGPSRRGGKARDSRFHPGFQNQIAQNR